MYIIKNFALYMWGNGTKLLSVVHGHVTFFKEFLHMFLSQKIYTHVGGNGYWGL
jgi:hypothetical protein